MTSKIRHRSKSLGKLSLDKQPIEAEEEGERPTFSFRYLNMDVSVKRCDSIVFRKFVTRLRILSEMTWKNINVSDRHQYGWELIARESLKPQRSIPAELSDVSKFHVFRYDSDNHPFVSVVKGNAIYPLFVEAKFGDVYNHG